MRYAIMLCVILAICLALTSHAAPQKVGSIDLSPTIEEDGNSFLYYTDAIKIKLFPTYEILYNPEINEEISNPIGYGVDYKQGGSWKSNDKIPNGLGMGKGLKKGLYKKLSGSTKVTELEVNYEFVSWETIKIDINFWNYSNATEYRVRFDISNICNDCWEVTGNQVNLNFGEYKLSYSWQEAVDEGYTTSYEYDNATNTFTSFIDLGVVNKDEHIYIDPTLVADQTHDQLNADDAIHRNETGYIVMDSFSKFGGEFDTNVYWSDDNGATWDQNVATENTVTSSFGYYSEAYVDNFNTYHLVWGSISPTNIVDTDYRAADLVSSPQDLSPTLKVFNLTEGEGTALSFGSQLDGNGSTIVVTNGVGDPIAVTARQLDVSDTNSKFGMEYNNWRNFSDVNLVTNLSLGNYTTDPSYFDMRINSDTTDTNLHFVYSNNAAEVNNRPYYARYSVNDGLETHKSVPALKCDDASTQCFNSQIATDTNGHPTISWYQNVTGSSNGIVRFTYWDNDLNDFVAAIDVNTGVSDGDGGSQPRMLAHDIEIDGVGNTYFAWATLDIGNGSRECMGRIFYDSNKTFSDAFLIDNSQWACVAVRLGRRSSENLLDVMYLLYDDTNLFSSSAIYWDYLPAFGVSPLSGIQANFSYTSPILDPENSITSITSQFTDLSTAVGTDVGSWQWDINGDTFSTDQNTTWDFNIFTLGDWNITLIATNTDNNISDQEEKLVRATQYPQSVDFNADKTKVAIGETVNFVGDANVWETVLSWQYDFGDGNTAATQNSSHVYGSAGDKNVCFTATNTDSLSRTVCDSIQVIGFLQIQFWDENTHVPHIPQNVTIDGNSWISHVDANAVLYISLADWPTGTSTIVAYDSNYSQRTWTIDLNELSEVNTNYSLLPTSLGQTMAFQMYAPDMTLFSNARVSVRDDLNHYAEIAVLDASGKTSFFLDGNAEYYEFDIVDVNGTPFTYDKVTVTVKVPKDESDLSLITPFDIIVSGIGDKQFEGYSTDVIMYLISDTEDYYTVTADANNYYARSYQVRIPGGPDTYTLQPYLVNETDAILSWFYTKNKNTGLAMPDVLINIKKNIPGEGLVLVQSVITDSTGAATVNWTALDEYLQVEFIYLGQYAIFPPNNDPYAIITANQTSYTVLLDFPEDAVTPNYDNVFVKIYPDAPYVVAVGTPPKFSFSEYVEGSGITKIVIDINQGDYRAWNIPVYSATYTTVDGITTGGQWTQDLDQNLFVDLNVARVCVSVTSTTTYRECKNLNLRFSDWAGYDMWGDLAAVTNEYLGGNGLGQTIIAILVTIAIVGAAAKFTVGPELAILGALVLGMFALFGWFDMTNFIMACVIGFASYVIVSKVAG